MHPFHPEGETYFPKKIVTSLEIKTFFSYLYDYREGPDELHLVQGLSCKKNPPPTVDFSCFLTKNTHCLTKRTSYNMITHVKYPHKILPTGHLPEKD
jgi:hypothetical protein